MRHKERSVELTREVCALGRNRIPQVKFTLGEFRKQKKEKSRLVGKNKKGQDQMAWQNELK